MVRHAKLIDSWIPIMLSLWIPIVLSADGIFASLASVCRLTS